MPDRILRAGILTSKAVNTLSFPAEVFYRRLMSVVDDFGRFDADPELLRSTLYPRKLSKVAEADIGKWLAECVATGLVSVYRVADEQYLEVAKFGQRMRAARSKWPPPPAPAGGSTGPPSSADICQQTADMRARPLSSAAVFGGGDGVDTPLPPSCGQLDEGDGRRSRWRWSESVAGVQGKAKELGLPPWDRNAFDHGEQEAWPLYRDRVLEAARAKAREPAAEEALQPLKTVLKRVVG